MHSEAAALGRWDVVAAPVGAAVAAGAVLLVNPFDGGPGFVCPLHAMTGLDCPGCGATRAAWLLLHLDVTGALRANALLLPALAYLVLRYVHFAAPARTAWVPAFVQSPSAIRPAALRALLLVIVVFTVARNLPAFSWLAPPELPGGNR